MSAGEMPARPRPQSIAEGRATIEDHLETVLRGVGPLAAYDQPIVESLGLTLHENVLAEEDLPRFDTADLDGYAVNSGDLALASVTEQVSLPVVSEVLAGSGKPYAISPGSCVKIMAGAPIPRGADAVVPNDLVAGGKNQAVFAAPIPHAYGVRRRGEDREKGQVALAEGVVLGPREIGLLAALGRERIKARPRPRVVLLSTGRELREPGKHLDPDSVADANTSMLAASVRSLGAIAYRVGVVDDDPRTFKRVLSDQLVRADIVVTTGGIGEGDRAMVKRTLTEIGEVTFKDVALLHAAPQGFGRVFEEQTPVITLPGDPAAAYTSFELFVVPAIRRMMGIVPYRRPQVHAVLTQDIASPLGEREYRPAYFEVTHKGAKVTPVPPSHARRIGSLAKANAFIVVGEDETALNMGDPVRTMTLDRPF